MTALKLEDKLFKTRLATRLKVAHSPPMQATLRDMKRKK